jgi:uncharacterized protein RhaS with RHS repeats
MHIRFTRFLLVSVTTLFCTLPFALNMAQAGQDHAMRSSGETSVFSVGPGVVAGSESVTWQPLLLAANENDDKDGKNGKDDKDDKNDKGGKDDKDHKDGNNGNNGHDKVYVCHVLPNGKFITQKLPKKTADKLVAEHPHEWILGKCEDVISPSHPDHDHDYHH